MNTLKKTIQFSEANPELHFEAIISAFKTTKPKISSCTLLIVISILVVIILTALLRQVLFADDGQKSFLYNKFITNTIMKPALQTPSFFGLEETTKFICCTCVINGIQKGAFPGWHFRKLVNTKSKQEDCLF